MGGHGPGATRGGRPTRRSTTTNANRPVDVVGGADGVCIWLTGLSGSGKTTTALGLRDVIERAGRAVTLLDGDVVRQHLLPDLGYTRKDRDRNVMAVAWVAAQIVRHGGVVICSLISPYRDTRARARAEVGTERFLEVFVDAPVEVCEARDVKGLYRRAKNHEVKGMTGVDDPYEPPTRPDIRIETVGRTVDENVAAILRSLADRGWLRGVDLPDDPDPGRHAAPGGKVV